MVAAADISRKIRIRKRNHPYRRGEPPQPPPTGIPLPAGAYPGLILLGAMEGSCASAEVSRGALTFLGAEDGLALLYTRKSAGPPGGYNAALHEDASIPRRNRYRYAIRAIIIVLILYLAAAYFILPALWHRHDERHPALADAEKITHTGAGIPGDPIDLALVGTEEELQRVMLAAKWYPADPITVRSSLRIAEDVVFRKPYVDAPVSNLYLFGRKEDLAFEQPLGDDPTRRHHVRFWKSPKPDTDGRPLWLGSATLDTSVGFSHDTGQITHHISPDVDHERTLIITELQRADALASVDWIDRFHQQLSGKNGEGDPWHTDGRLAIGIITPGFQRRGPSSVP
jgi:hypothetical protein